MKSVVSIVGALLVIHFIEDMIILSIGIHTPIPWWGKYLVGIPVSAILMTGFIFKLLGRVEEVEVSDAK